MLDLMTCFNRKEKTITAISNLISKNSNIEFKFVVVDDNSTDGTKAALEKIRGVTFIIGAVILKIYPIDWKWIYHILFLNMFVPNKEWMWWNSVNFFWTVPAFVAWYLLSYPLFKTLVPDPRY